jgi:hypothetical protein
MHEPTRTCGVGFVRSVVRLFPAPAEHVIDGCGILNEIIAPNVKTTWDRYTQLQNSYLPSVVTVR